MWLAGPVLSGPAATTSVSPQVLRKFHVTLPDRVQAGTAVSVQIMARDAQDRDIPTYGGTANVTSNDVSAILPKSVTFSKGEVAFQVTFNSAGMQTVTITNAADPKLFVKVSTTATPASPTSFEVTLSRKTVQIGAAVQVQVIALDAHNRLAPAYVGAAKVACSDKSAMLSPNSITFNDGKATFNVTFATTGAQSVIVTDARDSSLRGLGNGMVTAPSEIKFVLQLPPAPQSGETIQVQVVAKDIRGQDVSSYTGTANVTSSDPSAKLPAKGVTISNGQGTFQVTFSSAGPRTVTVTDSTNPRSTGSGATNVKEREPVQTHAPSLSELPGTFALLPYAPSNTSSQPIGKLNAGEKIVDISILGDDILHGEMAFGLRHDGRESWMCFVRGWRDTTTDVARIFVENEILQFRWLPIDEIPSRSLNLLHNCVLMIHAESGKEPKFISLRRPVSKQPFDFSSLLDSANLEKNESIGGDDLYLPQHPAFCLEVLPLPNAWTVKPETALKWNVSFQSLSFEVVASFTPDDKEHPLHCKLRYQDASVYNVAKGRSTRDHIVPGKNGIERLLCQCNNKVSDLGKELAAPKYQRPEMKSEKDKRKAEKDNWEQRLKDLYAIQSAFVELRGRRFELGFRLYVKVADNQVDFVSTAISTKE